MSFLKRGRVMACVGGLYTVELAEDEQNEIQCRARGSFRHSNLSPLVGDTVDVDVSGGDGNAVISAICDRKNSLIRPPVANLDAVFIVMATSSPKPMLDMTDKMTAILEHNDIEPIIVIGKCELDREYAEELSRIYSQAGYRTFVLSCVTDEGVDKINEYIKNMPEGTVAAFAGASGVGKSTLMNKLFPSLELGTGGVSRKTERGRHTTRAVTLYPIGRGAYLADTPGFSMLDFERFDFFDLDELPMCFKEINERIGECRYTKCTHRKEDGCAIVEAVRCGNISKSRHESYVMLYDVLKNKNKWN